MKHLLVSLIGICVLSATAAVVTYWVVGPPDRTVTCDPDSLDEHHVCLATVREWPAEELLWVDARPRKDWEKDGLEGSVLVNDVEEWLDLEFEFLAKLNEGSRSKVVVYCNQSGCGSSKYVAKRLRERFAQDFGFEVFVLEGGFKALMSEEG